MGAQQHLMIRATKWIRTDPAYASLNGLFFSSRTQHTRCLSDWSSDVCSSDLSRIVKYGIEPWHQYVTVRSLENRIPIVAPNVYSPPWFPGASVIVDLHEDPKTKISYSRASTLRSEEHTSELQSLRHLVCRLLL